MNANFCSELTGDVLTACKSIPESCVSLNAPPFNQIVGEPELFIRIKKVIQEASLGTHRFFVLGPPDVAPRRRTRPRRRAHRHRSPLRSRPKLMLRVLIITPVSSRLHRPPRTTARSSTGPKCTPTVRATVYTLKTVLRLLREASSRQLTRIATTFGSIERTPARPARRSSGRRWSKDCAPYSGRTSPPSSTAHG